MSKPTPSDLIPIETAGEFTKRGAWFFLVAATNGEIVIYKPASRKFNECSERQISDFLDNDIQYVKSRDRIYAPSKIFGPIESINELYISQSAAESYAKKSVQKKKEWNKSLLKLVGALIKINYEKSPYIVEGKLNVNQVKTHIHEKLSLMDITVHGIDDRSIRNKITDGYQLFIDELPEIIAASINAIEENKIEKVQKK